MNSRIVVYVVFVLSVIKLSNSTTAKPLPKCGRTDANRFPSCVEAGFSSTAVSLTNYFFTKPYSESFNNITAKLGNCSIYMNYIMCSLYVPRCKEDLSGPWLPCQEICMEFVRGCGDKMNLHGLNWLKPLCGLLPSKDKNSGASNDCFEPPGFKPSGSTPGLSCDQTVKNDQCKDVGKTFVSEDVQDNKTFINNENNAILNLNATVDKSTECHAIVTQLACASYTPPCEKDGNKMKMMTLCRSKCVDMFDHCPETYNVTEVKAYCAVPAEGNSDSGFCELKRWPSSRHWDTGSPSGSLPYSFSPGLIAVLVLVPLLAIISIYVAVAVRRHYVQKKSGYVQQQSTYTEPDVNNPTA